MWHKGRRGSAWDGRFEDGDLSEKSDKLKGTSHSIVNCRQKPPKTIVGANEARRVALSTPGRGPVLVRLAYCSASRLRGWWHMFFKGDLGRLSRIPRCITTRLLPLMWDAIDDDSRATCTLPNPARLQGGKFVDRSVDSRSWHGSPYLDPYICIG